MNRLVLPVVAVAGLLVAVPAPAHATPSCVAQSVQSEHAALGPAWGHDLIAALASDRDLLRTFGFDSFGKLASFGAAQDPENCPPDL
jgi:hypothetical protein